MFFSPFRGRTRRAAPGLLGVVLAAATISGPATAQPHRLIPIPAPVLTSDPADTAPLPFTRVYQSTTSAYGEPLEVVVRSDAEWRRAWLGAHPNRAAGPPPAPAVDFSRDLVVIVTAGEQRTGGVTVGVESVRPRADGGVDVAYTVSRPGAGCMSTQQVTAPVDVVRLARLAGEVRFIRRERAAPC